MLFEQQTGLWILKKDEEIGLIGNEGHMGHGSAPMGLELLCSLLSSVICHICFAAL